MTALTTAERQSRRQATLDSKAQALGYPTWRKFETDLINDELEITMTANVAKLVENHTWNKLEELVSDACTTSDTDGLNEWLAAGSYDGTETIESLAEDWDEVIREASEL